jgi:hypothetical protein
MIRIPISREHFNVVKVIDDSTVVINAGKADIHNNDLFIVYKEDDEIFDPITAESLGKLQIIKGTAKVLHIQDNMTTIKSNKTKNIQTKTTPIMRTFGPFTSETVQTELEDLPFDRYVEIGDIVEITNRV